MNKGIDFKKALDLIYDNHIVAFLQEDYSFRDVDELYEIVQKVSNKKEIQHYEILLAMEKSARLYELFRPYKIVNSDHYYGSVKMIDGIFGILYDFMGLDHFITFSKTSTFEDTYKLYHKRTYDEILWANLLNDIETLGITIKKTICQKSVELFSIVGQNSHVYLKPYIIQYVKDCMKDESTNVDFVGGSDYSVKVNGKLMKVESEHQFRYALFEFK